MHPEPTLCVIDKMLFEILVPATEGHYKNEITVRYHQGWDEKVRAITGGLTIMKPAKGEWVVGEEVGVVFREPMIPVRVWATPQQIDKIARLTMEYYDQKAVMYYCISTAVCILKREE